MKIFHDFSKTKNYNFFFQLAFVQDYDTRNESLLLKLKKISSIQTMLSKK